MNALYNIICDNQQEADFAEGRLKQLGFALVVKQAVPHFQLFEVDGTPPNYVFSGKYARDSATLWVVTASR